MLRRLPTALVATAAALAGFAPPAPAAARAAPPATVTVAVIDGGIDDAVPALRGVVAAGTSRSFVGVLAPPSLHGTLVAGLIAGSLSPPSPVPIRLLDLRVRDAAGEITPDASARAIRYAAAAGARVINLSYGSSAYSAAEASAVRYAVSRGVVVVASAGNVGASTVQWPARLQHVIAVGSLDAEGLPSAFSDSDPLSLDLTALGEDVQSTIPVRFAASGLAADAAFATENGFVLDADGGADGTSFATAEVSAAAARLVALAPQLTADQVRSLLVRGADDLGPSGYDDRYGWGRLDLGAAEDLLVAGGAAAAGPPDSAEPDDDTTLGAPVLPRRARTTIRATASTDDDRADVRRLELRAGDHVVIDLWQAAGPASRRPDLDLVAFSPTLEPVAALRPQATRLAVGFSAGRGVREHIVFTARRTGAFPVAVLAARGHAAYWLRMQISR